MALRQLPGLQLQVHDPYEAALTSSTHASIRKNVHLSVSGEMRLTAEVLVASERACETACWDDRRRQPRCGSHEGRDSEHGGALGTRR